MFASCFLKKFQVVLRFKYARTSIQVHFRSNTKSLIKAIFKHRKFKQKVFLFVLHIVLHIHDGIGPASILYIEIDFQSHPSSHRKFFKIHLGKGYANVGRFQ